MFTLQNVLKNFGLIVGAVLVNKIGAPGNLICYSVLLWMASQSSAGAMKALSLSALTTASNPALVSMTFVVAILRFVLIFVAAARIFADMSNHRRSPFSISYINALLLFSAVAGCMSFINNYFLFVSLLKLLSFTVGVFAILSGAEILRMRNSDLTAWFYAICLYLVVAGFAALALGFGWGVEFSLYGGSEEFLFKGALFHSQTLGAIGSLVVCYLFCIWLYTSYALKTLTFLLIIGLTYQIYLTSSRTGIASLVLTCGIALSFSFFMRKGRRVVRFAISKAKVLGLSVVGLVTAIIVEVASGGITSRITSILLKRSTEALSIETVLSSRESVYDQIWANFMFSPWTGIGFGTSTDPWFVANANLFSAPTEKGLLPLAVLEENGIIGGFFFYIFVGVFLWRLLREANISGFCMLIVFLFCNLGEMIFFSLGGIGVFAWVLVGAGISLGDRCVIRRPGIPQRVI